MDTLYIVIWRGRDGIWKPQHQGVHRARRLAETQIEIAKKQGELWEFAIVEGPAVSSESMEEAERRLGAF